MSSSEESSGDSARLVFAMCHEISNLVAAVRLQAHLLHEDLDPRGLAVTSLEIDDSSARSSALLALVRPVLSDPRSDAAPVAAEAILHGLERAIEEYGGRGVEMHVESAADLPEVIAEPEVLHYLLLTHLYGAMDAAGSGGRVRVVSEVTNGEVAFVVEDTGDADDQLLRWWDSALRGRVLGCAIASHVLAKRGGHLEVRRENDCTRTAIWVARA